RLWAISRLDRSRDLLVMCTDWTRRSAIYDFTTVRMEDLPGPGPFCTPGRVAAVAFGAVAGALFFDPLSRVSAVVHGGNALLVGTMSAAEETAAGFHAVADNLAAAMFTLGRERMNRAFEAIEITRDSGHHDFQRFVVFVAADFASVHIFSFPAL